MVIDLGEDYKQVYEGFFFINQRNHTNQMGQLLRFLAFPFALCYGLVIRIRNKCFDTGWFCKSKSYPIPLISLGNLTMGGTGKTPHIEYLIRLLEPKKLKIATLSRGYGRRTRGYRIAEASDNAEIIGDEPMQYVRKFRNITVAVAESRREGIEKLLKGTSRFDVILMDDAFQHRWVKPGLSILLTDFHNLYTEDHLLPTGTLREHASSSTRADIIIVTKSGRVLSPITRRNLTDQLAPAAHQRLYFSYITYDKLKPLPGVNCPKPADCYSSLLVFSGIANTYPFKYYLTKLCSHMESLNFPDHHRYSLQDINGILKKYDDIFTKNKAIVTTEKDAMRLQRPEILNLLKGIPIYYLPIKIAFHNGDGEAFNQDVLSFVSKYRRGID
ncbi:MAG: tetraacyldisaccharide 4'-kinase [Bacteroidales bacterium]|nr:tetraacyldisaccharide 4'-kinase [Bacteroidales bacterium]